MGQQEVINYGDEKVPILRESIREMYIALSPPSASPYMVVPRAAEAKDIIKFFSERTQRVEGLRAKMRKRFEKSPSARCTYRTGDIAYVMGRPFMLQVFPIDKRGGAKGGMRGRATVKFHVDTDVSLITLWVMTPKDYDQAKLAFLSYAERIILNNAKSMAAYCFEKIAPDSKAPQVLMRDMRNKFAQLLDGKLWISTSIVPYPVDCLAFEVWHELMPLATIPKQEVDGWFEKTLSGWRRAQALLAEKAKPYSNQ